ncbi:hypothetical protein F5878DRAFT_666848 [Lentinula raphanica]|uniref:Uncharacterized protein n=1 Tax=Lentinula raphanica TaxID=153919 RepID=A0AA38NWW3_9AGAR|nr:hypothetical protein F5878DRAFT_666848 [Lentinula raphanica]
MSTSQPKRYVVLGPSGANPRPGVHTSMPFRKGGFNSPPLPIPIQTKDEAQANALYNVLGSWVETNYPLPPDIFVDNFLHSTAFQKAEAALEDTGDGWCWVVIYGSKTGIFLNMTEAQLTLDVDNQLIGYIMQLELSETREAWPLTYGLPSFELPSCLDAELVPLKTPLWF